jgi:hypothetical protein
VILPYGRRSADRADRFDNAIWLVVMSGHALEGQCHMCDVSLDILLSQLDCAFHECHGTGMIIYDLSYTCSKCRGSGRELTEFGERLVEFMKRYVAAYHNGGLEGDLTMMRENKPRRGA